MNAEQLEIELMLDTGRLLDQRLTEEFVAQGHHLTGAWEQSLHGNVLSTEYATILRGEMASYGIFVQGGVDADRIPYGGAPTGAGTSKYIQALKNYWMLRGLSEKQALSAAFATAKTHKKEGMPTAGSYAFSSTGERKTFITITKEKSGQEIRDKMKSGLNDIVLALFNETKSQTI